MAEKRRFLDVWLTEPNTVYREVPYTVVADWVQQSRIQPDDMLRPSGTAQWFRVGDSPEFKPYIPTAEAVAVEDEADARADVVLDFQWKKKHGDEDDDVDMIPLIDVSLVLLVFFMMTSAVASAAISGLQTPPADNGMVLGKNDLIFINVKLDKKRDNAPLFSITEGENMTPAVPEDDNLFSVTEVVTRVRDRLQRSNSLRDLTIRADENVESGLVRDLSVELAPLKAKIKNSFVAVSEVQK